MITLSATSLKDYKACPYRMLMRRQKFIPTDSVPLLTGRVVHDIIEMWENGKFETSGEAILTSSQLIAEQLANDTPVAFTKWDSVMKIHQAVHGMIKNYFKHQSGEVLESETSFEEFLSTADGTKYRIVGRIDQIVDFNGEIAIVDLKTSRKPPTIFEIVGDYQFTMYALAYYIKEGILPDHVYNFYLPTGQYIEYVRTPEDVSEFRKLLDQTVYELTEIKEWQEYHKSKGYQCNFCRYANMCYDIRPEDLE